MLHPDRNFLILDARKKAAILIMDVIASLCAPLVWRAVGVASPERFFGAKQSFPVVEETASSQKTSFFAEAQDKRSDILELPPRSRKPRRSSKKEKLSISKDSRLTPIGLWQQTQ